MVWPNKTARPWEFRCDLSASRTGTGIYATPSGVAVANWKIPWGVPYSPGNHCIYLQLSLDFGASTWQITYQVPMAFTGAATSGTLASGVGLPSLQAYVEAADWFEPVDSACNWALSGSITLKYSTDNGTIMTGPTFTVVGESGSGFDKRNCADYVDLTIPYVDTLAAYGGFGAPICFGTESTETANDGTLSSTGTVTWGYHYENDAGTAWRADDVVWDNSFGSDSPCSCRRSPINISGIDSWSNTVVLNAYWERSITDSGSWTQTCTVRGKETTTSGDWWDVLLRLYFDLLGYAKVVPKAFGIPITERTLVSGCNGVIDQNTDVTTHEKITYCSFHKTSGNGIGHQTCHDGAFLVGCPPPISITSDGCGYQEDDSLFWPTAPPCGGTQALSYDVSKAFRHGRTSLRDGTGTFWLGVSPNDNPAAWIDVDSGLTATWARMRWKDEGQNSPAGVLYGDGSNINWAQTYDEGKTWVDTYSLGTGMFADFEESADGSRWFYKVDTPDSGVTYNIYYRREDAKRNTLVDWTLTNLTNVDNDFVACRESPADDGTWRMGLLYSAGGDATFKVAGDGALNFS